MNCELSIIVPVYNTAQYLPQCIESILKQSFKNWEHKEHTPENAVVFLTGIGKCYPILRSHKVLNNLHQAFVRCPVVMFFPGTYNEQELILFNEIKDDNYYRAFRLVK